MKLRHLVAGLFLVLALPLLLPFVAGALVTGILCGIAALYARRRTIAVRVRQPLGRLRQEQPRQDSLRGYGHRPWVTFDERGRQFVRGYDHRLRAVFDERGSEWAIMALGLAAAVALGALIAGYR